MNETFFIEQDIERLKRKIISASSSSTLNTHTASSVPNTTEKVDLIGMVNEINTQVKNTNNITNALVPLSNAIVSKVATTDGYTTDSNGSLLFTCANTRYGFAGAFFNSEITEINFTFVGVPLWVILGGNSTSYSAIRLFTDATRKIADFAPPTTSVRISSPAGTYNPVNGDEVIVKFSPDKLSVIFRLKKVGETVYSDWFTFKKSDYPTVLNWGTGAFTQIGIAPEVSTTITVPKLIGLKCFAGELENTFKGTLVNSSLSQGFSKFKKGNFLGDSVTGGVNTIENFVDKLQKKMGIPTINNYGHSGSILGNYTGTDTESFVTRYSGMEANADLIVVFGGTNDYQSSSSVLGIMTDRVATTFYGALHVLYSGLKTKYPTSTIVAITPLKRNRDGVELSPEYSYHGSLKLIDYVNAIKLVAEYYSIPVLDLYNKSGIYPYPYACTQVTTLIPDGLHPNEAGHEIITRMLSSYLNTL